jgi:hypothetical protein
VHQLGRASHVRFEAVVGDAAEALRLLAAIRGVDGVEDRGKLGIHQAFDLRCDEDLREDVGALAAQKGWAVRELSFRRATLEELFARIALGIGAEAAATPSRAAAPAPGAAPTAEAGLLPTLESGPAPAAGPPGGAGRVGKKVYNLNPFDQGARRDLGAPKLVESEPPPADAKREQERREEEPRGEEPGG